MYGGSVISCSVGMRAYARIEPASALVLESGGEKCHIAGRQDLRPQDDLFDVARAILDYMHLPSLRCLVHPKSEITPDHRRYAKVINFGLMYGMGANRISRELNISRQEASDFIEKYFEKFPTIQNYIQAGIQRAHEYGYVSTIFGRRLYLPDLQSSNGMKRSGAERVATNMPIQGSAADILKIAMLNLHRKIKDNPEINLLIQVHDELVFEVKKDKLETAKKLIRSEMENALPADMKSEIPLLVDIGVGKNWLEAH
ncbi:MAG: DNA polymerase, partial [Candidatus Cloacimonadales bacterium]